jgi:hypothetical protein
MATITGLTKERMLEIEAASIVDGEVVGDDLILTTFGGTPINAGDVRGPIGPEGPMGVGLTVDTMANRPVANGGRGLFAASDEMILFADTGQWQYVRHLNGDVVYSLPDLSGADVVVTNTGTKPTTITYNRQGGPRLMASVLTYNADDSVNTITHTVYAIDGVTALYTITETYSYSGGLWTGTALVVAP